MYAIEIGNRAQWGNTKNGVLVIQQDRMMVRGYKPGCKIFLTVVLKQNSKKNKSLFCVSEMF